MLLLHEFHERKFILPDKLTQRDKAALTAARRGAAAAAGAGSKKGKKGKPSISSAAAGGDAEDEEVCGSSARSHVALAVPRQLWLCDRQASVATHTATVVICCI
jgi:hypothetical protein